jgi:hypothetical protein
MGSTRPDTIGRYKIVESIGGGGMGTLYLARDPKIANRQVVIKLLREGFDNPELRERFAREADAAGGLRHANVVTIFDVGEFDGQPFIAMDYIQGETLIELIQRDARLSLGRKLQLMDELCAGLHYAHRAGVVHRDIKPANIMVDQDGVLKILDFGIARLGGSGMTQVGMVMGTLNYMSPEQMEGRTVDARADQFSAGAVFYELLSYRRAFPGELPGVVHKIMTGTREPLATLLPNADPGLIAIVDRCMAHVADDRYADMLAVRRDLAPVRQRVAADEQKHIHLRIEQARSAIGRGEFEAALRACEDALVLDSEYGPVLELQQEARAALTDRRVKGYLTHARSELDRGALTAAELLVEQALGENAASSDALAAREAIGEARRRVSEAQERARLQASLLAQAQQQFDSGSFDLALQTLDEALTIDVGDVGEQEAQALKDRVVAAAAARRRAEQAARERAELEARARTAVDAARQQFLAGQHAAALSALERFMPAHSIVTAALADLRVEMQEMERRRLEAELRRVEEERRRRERQEQEEEEEARRLAAEATRQRLEDEARWFDRFNAVTEVFPGPAVDPVIRIDPPATIPSAPVEPTIRLERAPTPATGPATVSSSSSRRVPWTVVAIVAILVATIAGVFVRRASAPEPAGTVVFHIIPWARIDAITPKAGGRTIAGANLVTPCVVALAPGEYHVRATNPNFPPLDFDLTVKSGGPQEVRYRMPAFDPEKEVTAVVGR